MSITILSYIMEPNVSKIVYPYTSNCGIKYQIMPGGPEGRGYILYEDGSTGTTGPSSTQGPMSVRASVSNAGPVGPVGPASSTALAGPTTTAK